MIAIYKANLMDMFVPYLLLLFPRPQVLFFLLPFYFYCIQAFFSICYSKYREGRSNDIIHPGIIINENLREYPLLWFCVPSRNLQVSATSTAFLISFFVP